MPDPQIERIMQGLKVSEQEALEIYACDKAIDRGERVAFDLPPDQEKEAKKMANVREHKKPTIYKFNKRERAENTTKSAVVAVLAEALQAQGYESVNITNKEREVTFSVADTSFTITLVQHRKPKASK